MRNRHPGALLLAAAVLAGVMQLLDVVVVVLVRIFGAGVAFPGDAHAAGADLLWVAVLASLMALVVVAGAAAGSAWWLARSRGPAFVAFGVAIVPMAGLVAILPWLNPLVFDTTCSICDAITYDAAPGPVGYRAVRIVLAAMTMACLAGALAAACSSATTRRIRAVARPVRRRPGVVTVACGALTALGTCAAVLSVTTLLIALAARKHVYRGGFEPLPVDERALIATVAGVAAFYAVGTLRQAGQLRRGQGGAALLTLSGLGLAIGTVLVTLSLLTTPRGGVVPSGWWVLVDPPGLREVHGAAAWAALAALLVALITVPWPGSMRWVAHPSPDQVSDRFP
ncbi:hypothetical protein [Nocardia sp. N2S4-5]|uniref:hypothetical protein n=1 Tax=Nocardia sp. N2S4-5 TaxID=3351565 RepID=UPI0037D7AD13